MGTFTFWLQMRWPTNLAAVAIVFMLTRSCAATWPAQVAAMRSAVRASLAVRRHDFRRLVRSGQGSPLRCTVFGRLRRSPARSRACPFPAGGRLNALVQDADPAAREGNYLHAD